MGIKLTRESAGFIVEEVQQRIDEDQDFNSIVESIMEYELKAKVIINV